MAVKSNLKSVDLHLILESEAEVVRTWNKMNLQADCVLIFF